MALSIATEQLDAYYLITLEGDVDTKTAPSLLDALNKISLAEIKDLRIEMEAVAFLSSAGLRALVFAKQKMPYDSKLTLIKASESIAEVIEKTGLSQAVSLAMSHEEII